MNKGFVLDLSLIFYWLKVYREKKEGQHPNFPQVRSKTKEKENSRGMIPLTILNAHEGPVSLQIQTSFETKGTASESTC